MTTSLSRRFNSALGSVLSAVCLLGICGAPHTHAGTNDYLSPTALVATKGGQSLFVACFTGHRVLRVDTATRTVGTSIPLPGAPSGLVLSADETRLFVTCAAPQSQVCVVDLAEGRIAATLPAGHSATAPVLSPDGSKLYVCNRFNDDVGVYDLPTRKELGRIKVRREPVAAAITVDGRFLLVANLLHDGPADARHVAAVVSVIDTAEGRVTKELVLPSGSSGLNDLRVSPDGRYAVVSHILARFHLPTTQLDRGWMNTNAETLIDLARMEIVNTVLLDSVDRGAANPWGVAWTADGATLVVAHAGTHEISAIDFAGLVDRLTKLPTKPAEIPEGGAGYSSSSRSSTDVPNDLAFLVGIRQRMALPAGERGPRAVTVVGTKAYVANYFSDTIAVVDLAASPARWESIPLGPKAEMSEVRKGEMYFHDAGICFQGWQSCASCHPGDARVDALNWDLLNDGMGNPKNNKSLLLSHRTPPAMSMGVRETAETAVRAGIRHILFTQQPEEIPRAMDEYLKALQPVPSPHLVDGGLSPAVRRGQQLFVRADCATCHPSGLFTDLQPYDVGTRNPMDRSKDELDTPTLIELWRTGPYLHDGSAATVREVLTTRNPQDRHGKTSGLSKEELDDLCAYLLSL